MRICHGQTIEGFYGDVYVSQITGEKKSCFCGGTLVASNYVITAGHCLYEWNENTDRVTEKLVEWKIYVRIGEYNTELTDDTGIEKIFQVEEIIKHPKHDLDINDVGIEEISPWVQIGLTEGLLILPHEYPQFWYLFFRG